MLNNITLILFNDNFNKTKYTINSLFYNINSYIPTTIININNNYIDSELAKYFNIISYSLSNNYGDMLNYVLKNKINTDYAIICDNNILFTPLISQLIVQYTDYDIICEINKDSCIPDRILPYFFIINIKKLKETNITFFDKSRYQIKLKNNIINNVNNYNILTNYIYDLGASFYDDIKNTWSIKNIALDNYLILYERKICLNLLSNIYTNNINYLQWLLINKNYYKDL